MYPFGSQFPGNGFGKDPLRRLGGSETRKVGLSPQSRCVAACHNGAFSGFDHRRREPTGQMQQRHGVHLKIAIEHLRIDFHEIAERTTHRVVMSTLGIPSSRRTASSTESSWLS